MAVRRNPNAQFDELKHVAAQARLPFDREAWLNLAFYLDEQYVEWAGDGTNGTIRRIARPRRTDGTEDRSVPRPVVNKIMHFVQQSQAMALQASPIADVLPATDDLMAVGDAAVAKAYCQYVAEPVVADFDTQLARATLWALIAMDGWLKWTWNDREKRPDICAPAFFEIFPDPYAKDASRVRHLIHAQFMDVEQVYEAWGVEVSKSAVETADPMRTELLRGMGSSPVVQGVTVNELWMKPCRRYPKGLFTAWTGTQQLTKPGPLPYEHRRLPFTMIGALERPDSLHYMSPVKYLRSAQMQLNKYHAQRIMTRERFANPKWWIPSELDLEALPDSSPNQILRGNSMNGQLRPEILTPAAMTDNGDGAMIEEQMMHVVGLHEVSQAQVPGRVEAAKAIEMLKEADADRLRTLHKTIDRAIAEGWWQVLMLAKQYETDDKMVQTYTREGLPEVQRFRKERIDPGLRIKVTRGTGLARSRAARQDQLMLLWDKQIITDPSLMAELMEVSFPSFADPKALDLRLARNENIVLAGGQAVTPNSWDNHQVHLRAHNDYRKTEEYLTLSKEAKERFEHHCKTHEDLQRTELMKQAQLAQIAAMATGQAPAGPPGGAPPDETATPPDGASTTPA